jgi:hypothetical protein
MPRATPKAPHTDGWRTFWCLLKRFSKGNLQQCRAVRYLPLPGRAELPILSSRLNDGLRFIRVVAGIVGKRLIYEALIGEMSRVVVS